MNKDLTEGELLGFCQLVVTSESERPHPEAEPWNLFWLVLRVFQMGTVYFESHYELNRMSTLCGWEL